MTYSIDATNKDFEQIAKGLAAAFETYPDSLTREAGVPKAIADDRVVIFNLRAAMLPERLNAKLAGIGSDQQDLFAAEIIFANLKASVMQFATHRSIRKLLENIFHDETLKRSEYKEIKDFTKEILQNAEIYDKLQSRYISDARLFPNSKQIVEDMKNSITPLFRSIAEDMAESKGELKSGLKSLSNDIVSHRGELKSGLKSLGIDIVNHRDETKEGFQRLEQLIRSSGATAPEIENPSEPEPKGAEDKKFLKPRRRSSKGYDKDS